MAHTPDQTFLKPSFCFNQTALRDFLRLSRASIDDTILQNLNALATPASQPFEPSRTSGRDGASSSLLNPKIGTTSGPTAGQRGRGGATFSTRLPMSKCAEFKAAVLFPSWQARSDVLNYCAGVATSPDPDDPEHVLRANEDARARERLVDERLDPYSGRYFPREARTEALAATVRNERAVESIIRARTWGLVGERCGDPEVEAETALDEWRRRHAGS